MSTDTFGVTPWIVSIWGAPARSGRPHILRTRARVNLPSQNALPSSLARYGTVCARGGGPPSCETCAWRALWGPQRQRWPAERLSSSSLPVVVHAARQSSAGLRARPHCRSRTSGLMVRSARGCEFVCKAARRTGTAAHLLRSSTARLGQGYFES